MPKEKASHKLNIQHNNVNILGHLIDKRIIIKEEKIVGGRKSTINMNNI